MAVLKMYKDKLRHNYEFLEKTFKKNSIEWAVVSKILCGNKAFLKEVIQLGIKEICDSRISNLRTIKELSANIQTVYIKPPAKRSIPNVIRYADVSFNTEFETMKNLSAEAKRQNKTHKVVIMIELGDLREGVMGERLIDFYASVFELPNIEITGLGANLNCLYGVMPSEDKLIQLSLYKQLIEAKFNIKIPWVTGGTSVVFPLLLANRLPKGINHFRIGEMLFFGNNLMTRENVSEMKQDVFKLFAEIIEIQEKPKVPSGEMEENPSGEVYKVNVEDYGKTSYRAIIDVGLLDISTDFIVPEDEDIEVCGASSDMIVLDLGKTKGQYKVGDNITFKLKYMGALGLLNSNYIEKEVV
ncbi:MAG: alanine/ornithine racemase family PLP-dependent enzyme [Bacteroidota bacterium]|nr:alanine/ornithine racemase family PLP-dependent enzyme [Bacteroidota bacterium]